MASAAGIQSPVTARDQRRRRGRRPASRAPSRPRTVAEDRIHHRVSGRRGTCRGAGSRRPRSRELPRANSTAAARPRRRTSVGALTAARPRLSRSRSRYQVRFGERARRACAGRAGPDGGARRATSAGRHPGENTPARQAATYSPMLWPSRARRFECPRTPTAPPGHNRRRRAPAGSSAVCAERLGRNLGFRRRIQQRPQVDSELGLRGRPRTVELRRKTGSRLVESAPIPGAGALAREQERAPQRGSRPWRPVAARLRSGAARIASASAPRRDATSARRWANARRPAWSVNATSASVELAGGLEMRLRGSRGRRLEGRTRSAPRARGVAAARGPRGRRRRQALPPARRERWCRRRRTS